MTPRVEEIPASLRAEGGAMLRSLVEDLASFASVRTVCDPRQRDDFDFDGIDVVEAVPNELLWRQWVAAAGDCDHAVIVAPENDGALAQGVAMLRAAGIDVVAASGDFLRVASDKWLTAKAMHAGGVPHPPTWTRSHRKGIDAFAKQQGFIVKPRDGCGTSKIQSFTGIDEAFSAAGTGDIVQPLLAGRAVSVSLVAGSRGQIFLPAVAQEINTSRWSYDGGIGPLEDDLQRRAESLATLAVAAMPPSVRGFVGFDLLLGEGPPGEEPGQDYLIEINPRLTTSYVGLRQMIRGNLAARLFGLESGPVQCRFPADSVQWTPDGKVTQLGQPLVQPADAS